jgi:hypothetical protein
MRKLTLGVCLSLAGLSFLPSGFAAQKGGSLPGMCAEAPNDGGALREITCRIPSAALGEPLRFRARFSGGHDDTEASMVLTLDAQPLECDPGSKTELKFEEGDIALECAFTPPEQPVERAVRIRVRWSHCQYEGFELLPTAGDELAADMLRLMIDSRAAGNAKSFAWELP